MGLARPLFGQNNDCSIAVCDPGATRFEGSKEILGGESEERIEHIENAKNHWSPRTVPLHRSITKTVL